MEDRSRRRARLVLIVGFLIAILAGVVVVECAETLHSAVAFLFSRNPRNARSGASIGPLSGQRLRPIFGAGGSMVRRPVASVERGGARWAFERAF